MYRCITALIKCLGSTCMWPLCVKMNYVHSFVKSFSSKNKKQRRTRRTKYSGQAGRKSDFLFFLQNVSFRICWVLSPTAFSLIQRNECRTIHQLKTGFSKISLSLAFINLLLVSIAYLHISSTVKITTNYCLQHLLTIQEAFFFSKYWSYLNVCTFIPWSTFPSRMQLATVKIYRFHSTENNNWSLKSLIFAQSKYHP